MSGLVNGSDSIITCAPDFEDNTLKSNLPKPFENFNHLQNLTSKTDSPKSPALISPHNRAWFDSPDGFIGRIPESNILSKCVAFVDVWSSDGFDNRSIVFSRILNRMGATIARKFTKMEKITHLVFKDGHKSYLQKAKKRKVLIVNCLWVEKCKVTQTWIDETLYLFNDSNYVPPKKFREMQPLDPEEEQLRSAERAKRRQKREEKRAARKGVAFLSPLVTRDKKFISSQENAGGIIHRATIKRSLRPAFGDKYSQRLPLACDTPYNQSTLNYLNPLLVSETPSESILKKLQRMKEGKPIFSPPSSPLSDCSVQSDKTRRNEADSQKLSENIIPSSQSSDMDLTCIPPTEAIRVIGKTKLSVEETSDRNNHQAAVAAADEDSEIRLHVSGESSTLSSDTSTRRDLDVGPSESVSSLPKNPRESASSLPNNKALANRARRKLCDEEIAKPASILVSPALGVDRSVSLRRSQRRSSKLATQAISLLSNATVKNNVRVESPVSADTTYSVLPPPGSRLKSAVGRNRYFDPVHCPSFTLNISEESVDDMQLDDIRSSSLATKENEPETARIKEKPRKRKNKRCLSKHSTASIDNEENLSIPKNRKKMENSMTADKSSILKELMSQPQPRRSTDEFQSPLMQKKKVVRKSRRKSILVLTSLHSHERATAKQIVQRLGRFEVHRSVKDSSASHVVCGGARRTLNILHGISRGLWILSIKWLLDSMDVGRWLNEKDYEVDYFPFARKSRLLRKKFPDWKSSVFQSIKGFVYVSPETDPPANEIEDLITLCGGHVIQTPKRAMVLVGPTVAFQCATPTVKETWVFDSITENTLKPVENYLIV